ncbi:MAG: protein-L-isoaspartate(D-aspartate) O-methyltransferase [Bryobacteraceae bacterium]
MKDCRHDSSFRLLRFAFCAILALPTATMRLVADDPVALQRERMVSEQIESRGIRSPDVLRVMRATPRHLFVLADVRSMAYEDHPLPIGYGATISQPHVVALMTELLAPAKKHRVLEIGTGSGYQAAILGQLAAKVYTIEIVPELARTAARTLRELGYSNVTVRQGDGYKGWPEQAPFDRIMVTAAPPEVPATLIAQLSRGGRLVAPVGSTWDQELILIEKTADGTIRRTSAGAVSFVPMKPADK